MYKFFEIYISFISVDFILDIKDMPNESDNKNCLLKLSCVLSSCLLWVCNSKTSEMSKL